ncbi:MAG: hypothetical protein H0U21_04205 [Acidimicrobiia bacterium]|nr:hypothetical protein [Acidimicrobiia bacterium]
MAEHPDIDEDVERVRRRQLRCHLPVISGGMPNAATALRAAAAEIAAHDPAVAVDLLLDALGHHVRAGELEAILSVVEELAPRRKTLDAERGRRVDVIAGAVDVAAGLEEGEACLARYTEMGGPQRSSADILYLAEVVAPVLAFLRRTAESDALLAELDADLRARGAVWPLISVLNAQTLSQYGRSLPATMSAGLEAVALAEANGIPHHASISAGVLALCAATVGDRAACERAARLLRDAPEPERRALAGIGLGFLALNEGRLDDADVHYREVLALSPIGHGVVRWEPEWVEALLRSGRRDEADAVFAELQQAIDEGPLAYPRIARVQGLMAVDDDEAVRYFAAAVDDAQTVGNRVTEGRCEMSWGERLRRARKRAEARRHLERALALFREVGATLLAERATFELRAAGGVVGDEVVSHQLLTPHELQVARLVVGGASNRELAAKLFISPRTVEAHLTSIFRKLRVRNRRELSARALDDPILQP